MHYGAFLAPVDDLVSPGPLPRSPLRPATLPQVSLEAAVVPSAAVNATPEVALGAVFNGGKHHPGRGGHVAVTELLITLSQVGHV